MSYLPRMLLFSNTLFLIIFVIIFSSCKKDTPLQQPLQDALRSGGSWIISDLSDSDSLSKYSGNTFIFHADGKMQVQSSTASENGIWEAYNAANEVHLTIDIEGDAFTYLEGGWGLVTLNATQIQLTKGFWFPLIMTITKN